jgi:CRP-like cAMP-binding protein
MTSLVETLAAHPFFQGLAPAEIRKVAAHAREASFGPNALLLREGEAANASFVILEGRVGLEIRASTRTVQVASAGPGEVVGWSWLATPSTWHFDARASDDVRAIVLDGDALAALCERDHSLGYALTRRFMGVLTRRLEALRLQLVDLYGPRDGDLPWV